MKLNDLRVKTQLILLISTAILIMIIIQLLYYFGFNFLTQEKEKVYMNTFISQIEEKLENILIDVQSTASGIAYYGYVQEYIVTDDIKIKMNLNSVVADLITYVNKSNVFFCDIALLDTKGRLLTAVAKTENDLSLVYESLFELYNFSTEQSTEPIYSTVIYNKLDKDFYYAFIYPIYNVLMGSNIRDKIGSLIILGRAKDIQLMIQNINLTENSQILILDNLNNIIGSKNKQDVGKPYDISKLGGYINADNTLVEKYNNSLSIIRSRIIEDSGWKIISIIPINEITRDMDKVRMFGLLIVVFMIIVLIGINIIINRSIAQPISQIVNSLEQIADGNFKGRLTTESRNEIGQLTGYINRMIDSFEQMTRKVFSTQTMLYETELAKKQAELSALQSQINPHFLYNTLDCLKSIGYVYKSKEVVEISSSMAKIFRYSIKGDTYVKVEDEIECITNYLTVMKIRFNNKFIIDMSIQEDILQVKIIKMILQPIIENAVYHSLEKKIGEGRLTVSGRWKNSREIEFKVFDNGKGMDQNQLRRINLLINQEQKEEGEKFGIGLRNINKRIKLFFGNEYGLIIDSIENIGTEVTVTLPVIQAEEYKNRARDSL